jgi:hypothetical protein
VVIPLQIYPGSMPCQATVWLCSRMYCCT